MILKSEMVLYHGSYCEVKAPVIEKCRPGKDFGQGLAALRGWIQEKKQFPKYTCVG